MVSGASASLGTVTVPRPRLHLIRFHGVLAPNAKLWALVASAARRVGPSLEASCLAVDGWARPARPRIKRRCRVHPGACRLEGGVWISYAPEFAMPEVLVRLSHSQDRMFNY